MCRAIKALHAIPAAVTHPTHSDDVVDEDLAQPTFKRIFATFDFERKGDAHRADSSDETHIGTDSGKEQDRED